MHDRQLTVQVREYRARREVISGKLICNFKMKLLTVAQLRAMFGA
jgi:hypothetical protein